MADYKEYIKALKQCAKEHKNDITPTFQIRVSDLCEDTAKLLENDVIERSKINKAIEEMERDSTRYEYIDRHDLADVVDSCIGIILKYIKE